MNDSDRFVNISFSNSTSNVLAFKPMAILVFASVGIPLNSLIAFVIISMERLHKPRNIFWLGVIFSNLFALVTSLIEFVALYGPSRGFCTVFVLLVGIPYSTLLLNILLALIDRLVAITFPIWHRDKITLRWVFGAQLVGFILISLLLKSAHLIELDLLDIPCDENQPHGRMIVFTLLTLVMLCVIAQCVVYLKARRYFNQQRNGNPSTDFKLDRANSAALQSAAPAQEETTFTSSTRNSQMLETNRNSTFFIHVGSETISKLEVEAAWTLVMGAISLLLISSPIFVVLVSSLLCSHLYDDCISVSWLIPYFRELILIHTVYNPVVYIYRCREFRDALKIKFGLLCCSSKCCCCKRTIRGNLGRN